jgi:uncharacterized protein (TIGR02246 family)
MVSLVHPAVGDEYPEEEKAIRAAIKSYLDAFNRHDAKAVAAHWSATGEFVTPGGDVLRGTEQLERDFADYFANAANVTLELADPKIEFLSPNVALETGTARVLEPNAEPTETEYVAVHVKYSTGWKMDSVREQEIVKPTSHYDQLRELEWMIGEWVDEAENATVETVCRWTTNRNFITRSFWISVRDRVDFEGTQVIGWDPVHNVIRSWVFNSDGGFGVGVWSRDGKRWTIRSLNVQPDGSQGSATVVMEQVDENTLTFQTIGREVDGVMLPNIEPVKVVRKSEAKQ